ncbi:MAG: hypothetical protein IT379_29105 [Deltaproteobacteria bacterium]|nr:hypothetical protein [Deltaproteobacteria bacterium]
MTRPEPDRIAAARLASGSSALVALLLACAASPACGDDSAAPSDAATPLDAAEADLGTAGDADSDTTRDASASDARLDATPLDAGPEPPVPATIVRNRSLTWDQPSLLDDPERLGLARLMWLVAGDRHGGPLVDRWFRRFATTAHSERLGPQLLLEQLAQSAGVEPSLWDLDALPFRVTGVHNRIDLRSDAHCGEIRVSLASIDPILQPFHLIFLFRQSPLADDRDATGALHCRATARLWASFSELEEDAFTVAARALLDRALRADTFLVVETLEFLISPWEWRQWFLEPNPDSATVATLPFVLENRPLFQTVDSPRLNRPGPERDDFLAWVSANAAELDARRALVPDRFRAPSARVNQGVPWIPLDLSGVSPEVLGRYPRLRQQIEIVGCPACHATDAEFVQTSAERVVSPFYDKELRARGEHLRAIALGAAPAPPFGPLQAEPRLPP